VPMKYRGAGLRIRSPTWRKRTLCTLRDKGREGTAYLQHIVPPYDCTKIPEVSVWRHIAPPTTVQLTPAMGDSQAI
jgi:hypothetical protein